MGEQAHSVVFSLPAHSVTGNSSSCSESFKAGGLPRPPASVLLNISSNGSVAAAAAAPTAPAAQLERDLLKAAKFTQARRSREDASMADLQTKLWTATHVLILEALAAKLQQPRAALGLGELSTTDLPTTGVVATEQLRSTMRDVVALCVRNTGGCTQEVQVKAPIITGASVQLKEMLASLTLLLQQEVAGRTMRAESSFRETEKALAHFVAHARGLSLRAHSQLARLGKARAAALGRLAARAGGTTGGGVGALRAMETASATSHARVDEAVAKRVSKEHLLTHLRQQADRLHMATQVLLQKRLQLSKRKVRLLSGMGRRRSGAATAEEVQVALDAVTGQLARLTRERREVEAAWREATGAAVDTHSGGEAPSGAAVRVARRLAAERARMDAESAAVAETVHKALLEKLEAETRDAVAVVLQELKEGLLSRRQRLQRSTQDAMEATTAAFVRSRRPRWSATEELGTNIEVAGGGRVTSTMLATANTAVAQFVTRRMHQHLRFIDTLLVDTPTFIDAL